ncbi:hypothetical protein D3C83_158530 [compost metagenome]
MSPQRAWASKTSPGIPSARNVFRKNDSPPNIRFMPLRIPPVAVIIRTWVLMPTIEPDSAVTASFGSSRTRASECAGR